MTVASLEQRETVDVVMRHAPGPCLEATMRGAAGPIATGYSILAADVTTAIKVLLRLQRLVEDFPRVQEVEVNPFILSRVGGKSVAVDARLRVGG